MLNTGCIMWSKAASRILCVSAYKSSITCLVNNPRPPQFFHLLNRDAAAMTGWPWATKAPRPIFTIFWHFIDQTIDWSIIDRSDKSIMKIIVIGTATLGCCINVDLKTSHTLILGQCRRCCVFFLFFLILREKPNKRKCQTIPIPKLFL